MKRSDKEVIRLNHRLLVRETPTLTVVSYLHEVGVLNHHQVEQILQKPRLQRNHKLLIVLQRGKSNSFFEFLNSLKISNCHDLVSKLLSLESALLDLKL